MVEVGNLRLHCKSMEEYKIALSIVKKYIKNFDVCKYLRIITIYDIKTYDEWGKMINEINQQIKELKHV